MSDLAWLFSALKPDDLPAVTSCNQNKNLVLVTDFQSTSLINTGITPLVTNVTSVTREKQQITVIPGNEIVFSPKEPAIELLHRTTVDLIFNSPATGKIRTIPAGTPCRKFASPTSAMLAGVKLDYSGSWAATKNIERGYCLIWVEGALRGVHFSDVETNLERTTQ